LCFVIAIYDRYKRNLSSLRELNVGRLAEGKVVPLQRMETYDLSYNFKLTTYITIGL